jgi:hypothetical protein
MYSRYSFIHSPFVKNLHCRLTDNPLNHPQPVPFEAQQHKKLKHAPIRFIIVFSLPVNQRHNAYLSPQNATINHIFSSHERYLK